MPYRSCDAHDTFQRSMDILLKQNNWHICLTYLDDVILFRRSYEKHNKDVHDILTILQGVSFTLKLNKCDKLKHQIDYLRHTITPGKFPVS